MMRGKLLKISGLHGYDVTQALSEICDDVESASYDELRAGYAGLKAFYTDAFSKGMQSLGWDAQELYCDFELLQKKWAQENGARFEETTWREDILTAQIKQIKPDVVFSENISWAPLSLRKDRAREFPWVKALVSQQGFPMWFKELKDADIVFSCIPSIATVFRGWGINAHPVYYSFDPSITDLLSGDNVKEHGFTFTGHSGYGLNWHHRTRYELLSRLLEDSLLEAWLTERDMTLNPDIETPLRERFPDRTHPAVFGLDMYRLLERSRVILNVHTDATWGYSGNMRMYEATGMGACVLTDRTMNLDDLFEDGVEIVTYGSADECLEKARYLLDNDKEREAIGQKAKARTMKDHTALNRCEEMDRLIMGQIG
ncbi:glycosyltransferase [Pseudodesulfovibrio sp.]|nr:glycosyltransferase [Pseudodesulfovibrio sp.]